MGFPRGISTEVLWADKEEEEEEEENGEQEEKNQKQKQNTLPWLYQMPALFSECPEGGPMAQSNHLVGQMKLDCKLISWKSASKFLFTSDRVCKQTEQTVQQGLQPRPPAYLLQQNQQCQMEWQVTEHCISNEADSIEVMQFNKYY